MLPVIFFVVGTVLATIFYFIGTIFWKTSERNILAFTSGTGNTGYFGLPLIIALVGARAQSVAVLSTLGVVLYESTVGYYFIARHSATVKVAIQKVLHLPALYAFILGVFAIVFKVKYSSSVIDTFTYFRGAYVVLGMLIIGLGLSKVTKVSFDIKFTTVAMLSKFIAFPLAIAGFIIVDNSSFHLFGYQTHLIIMILSITPLASNTVAFATSLKAHPEKAAVTVMLSTIFALVYIPLFVTVLLK